MYESSLLSMGRKRQPKPAGTYAGCVRRHMLRAQCTRAMQHAKGQLLVCGSLADECPGMAWLLQLAVSTDHSLPATSASQGQKSCLLEVHALNQGVCVVVWHPK